MDVYNTLEGEKMYNNYSNYYFEDPFVRTFMIPAMPNTNDEVFIKTDEGFLRGNMEKDAYVPYKNMNYIKPMFNNQRQKDLYELQKVCFAAHDANLYLDTHPSDTNMIGLYNKYLKKEKELEKEYEQKYGPLNLSDDINLDKVPWVWINNPWPWNK